MPTHADDDNLVWLDLEMTGLDVERHTIVEIACIVTNSDLEPLDEGIDIVIHQDAEVLARMDDFVRKMHTKSGLLPGDQRVDRQPRRRARADARVRPQARARSGYRAVVRQQHRNRPPVP